MQQLPSNQQQNQNYGQVTHIRHQNKYQFPHSRKIWSQKWNIFQYYEIWKSEQVKFVNHRYDIWHCRSWAKIKDLGRFGLKIAMCQVFMKFEQSNNSEQIEHANYEYINWNWWPSPKITNLQNLLPKLKCSPIFTEFGT